MLLAVALVGGVSCASVMESDGEAGAVRAPETLVDVANHNWSDITVYVLREGTTAKVRLGTVTSMQREQFSVPRAVIGSGGAIRLVADPIGSRQEFVTYPINVQPGQRVEWNVENNLRLSSWTIRE